MSSEAISYESRPSRRLVLVRRDDVEHLLLVGGPGDVLIESRIDTPESKKQGEPAFAARAKDPAETITRPEETFFHNQMRTARQVNPKAQEKGGIPRQSAAGQRPHHTASASYTHTNKRREDNALQSPQYNPLPPRQNSSSRQHNTPPHVPAANRRPATSQADIYGMPRRTDQTANQPSAMQPSFLHQSPQQYQKMQAAAFPENSGNMAQQSVNMQTSAPHNMRQNSHTSGITTSTSGPVSSPSHPDHIADYIAPYQGYTTQQPEDSKFPEIPENINMNTNTDITQESSQTAPEILSQPTSPKGGRFDDLARNPEPDFVNREFPGTEDFDKILQEELMRSQDSVQPT